MRVFLTLGSHMGPWGEVFQTNIHIFGYFWTAMIQLIEKYFIRTPKELESASGRSLRDRWFGDFAEGHGLALLSQN